MKIKRMTDFAAVTLAVVMCFGCIAAHAAPTTPTEITPVSEPAFMERVTASDLPFEFAVTAYDDNTVTVSYGRTARSVATNEKMFVTDSETGKSAEKFDGTFDLSYNKVYKFSYMYESSGMKYYYDGEVSFPDSDGTPQPVFSNIVLNSFSSGSEIPRSAGVIYEIESNDTYDHATTTYVDYDSFGKISDIGDVDWWKITFTNSGTANFWLGDIPYGCDYDLIIYDSTGTHVVGGSVSSGNSSEYVSNLSVTAGTYYAKILWGDDGTSATEWYRLRINWSTYNITINITNTATSSSFIGNCTVEVRGYYDNYNVPVNSVSGTVVVPVPYNTLIGINIRAYGYFAYVFPNQITVTGTAPYSAELTPSQSIAQNAGFTAPLNAYDTYGISSHFGWRSWSLNNGHYANFDKHDGVDYSADGWTVIKSICDVSSEEFYSPEDPDASMGYYVEVELEDLPYTIRYMHMVNRYIFPLNATVIEQGDCIGYVGNSGNSTGYHLHIDIFNRNNNKFYEPNPFWGDFS